jgi:3-dehydroquinate synthase
MAVDKKASRGRIRYVLLEKPGAAVLRADVPEALVRQTLQACSASQEQAPSKS